MHSPQGLYISHTFADLLSKSESFHRISTWPICSWVLACILANPYSSQNTANGMVLSVMWL